jgi:hypothetical protein
MEVGQGPNWGCRAKEKRMFISVRAITFEICVQKNAGLHVKYPCPILTEIGDC